MTWIRVETNIGDTVEIGRLRSVLGLSRHQAIGMIVDLFGSFAEHQVRGDLREVLDTLIEDWARWQGEPGRFAQAFRQIFAPGGVCELWQEQQDTLIRRQEADRERKRRQRRRERGEPEPDLFAPPVTPPSGVTPPPVTAAVTRDNATFPAATERNVTERTTAVVVTRPITPLELTIALNKGMAANPQIGERYNPIVSTSATAFTSAEQLTAEGVDPDFALREIYRIASTYTPKKLGDQISSLSYVVPAVVAAWEREAARIAAATAPSPPEAETPAAATSGHPPAKASQNGTFTLRAGEIINLIREYRPPPMPVQEREFEEINGRLYPKALEPLPAAPPPAWRAELNTAELRAVDAIGVDRIRADEKPGIVLAQLSKAIGEASRG